jgi:hypothetical protein
MGKIQAASNPSQKSNPSQRPALETKSHLVPSQFLSLNLGSFLFNASPFAIKIFIAGVLKPPAKVVERLIFCREKVTLG